MGDISGVLDGARRGLEQATTLADVQRIVRATIRPLVAADGGTLVLREIDQCYYADEDAASPLWKGQRFPLTECISGWAMLNRNIAVIPNIWIDNRIPHEAYRPTFVQSLVMAPIRKDDPLGAIGAYWARHHTASDDEVRRLEALAAATGKALEAFLVEEPTVSPLAS